MRAKLKIAGKTDKGRKRSKNEDSFFVDPELGLMLVADGMGGHASGEIASRLATTLCAEQLKHALKTGRVDISNPMPADPDMDPRCQLLADSVRFSNQAVHEAAQKNPDNHNMGTTLVGALWLDDKMAVANVGDSRLYVVRDGSLTLCTVDHSFVQEQIDRGFITVEEAEKSDLRNMLTRAIGSKDDVEVDVREIEMKEGDYVLLCSDGLTKMLDHDQIEAVFSDQTDPQIIADMLIDQANQAGGGDNVTVIVAYLEPQSHWGALTQKVKDVLAGKPENG